MTKLNIKNMVCPRCIKVVREELEKLGHSIQHIELGEVELKEDLSNSELKEIKSVLTDNGFELIEDNTNKLIDKIKTIIIKSVHHSHDEKNESLSSIIENGIGKDYAYLSNLFSSNESITIEHYHILQKIEKAKELLKYGDKTLSEIAYLLGYNSVNHLSSQFKNVTGMTASEFKKNISVKRKPIDQLQ